MNAPMRAALKLATESPCNYRMGSVLAKGNKVMGRGMNLIKTHPEGSGPFQSVHAELGAIFSFLRLNGKFLKGYQIYVARVSKIGNIGMARPCQACLTFIKQIGIQDIYYTNKMGMWTGEKI